MIGQTIGPYAVLSKLGEGGMGEVYRARDTRLDRTVALKVSKTDFDDRFEREARGRGTQSSPHLRTLRRLPIESGTAFSPGTPKQLFNVATVGIRSVRRQYAVSADGQRFLVNVAAPEHPQTILLQNWLSLPGKDRTKSSLRSGQAEWARSIARGTPSSTVTSR